MNNMISLVCPSCGGKLAVSNFADKLVCEHCGNEHIIRREGDKASTHATCPNCGLSDKSMKVSAIVATQTHELSGVNSRPEIFINSQGIPQIIIASGLYSGKQASVLSQRLAPPVEPQIPYTPPQMPINKKMGCGTGSFIGALTLFGVSGLCSFVNDTSPARNAPYFIFGTALIALIFIAVGVYFKGEEKEKLKMTESEHNKKVVEYQRNYESQKNEALRVWKRAMARWETLYYCERDDCIFLPKEKFYAPASQMGVLLNK
jgi:predicted RNA-binding Zn-ribbon protein involved in translation (DUF1610 family)